jgi:hypothetical protein
MWDRDPQLIIWPPGYVIQDYGYADPHPKEIFSDPHTGKKINQIVTVTLLRGLTKVGHFAESFKGVSSCPGRVAVITVVTKASISCSQCRHGIRRGLSDHCVLPQV